MSMSMAGSRWIRSLLLLTAASALAGCGRGSGVPQFKVHGKVLSHGVPAAGAIVVFHPTTKTSGASRYLPRGVAGSDGTFALGSRTTDDGVPPGDYAVTIVWPADEDPKKQFDNTPPDRLRNRYNDVKHPQWNVHVTEGANTLEAFTIE